MRKNIIRLIHWLLLALIIIYIVSGFGISEYRIVEFLSGGILSKAISFKLHQSLEIPFIALLLLHIYFAVFGRKK